MVRAVLRVIGVLCLGGAVLAGLSWREATTKLFPVDKEALLQAKEIVSVSFVPAIRVSEDPGYLVKLKFKGAQQAALDCKDIQTLRLRWALSEDIQVKQWSAPQNHACENGRDGATVGFSTPQLKPGIRQYLHIATKYDVSKNNQLEVNGIRIHIMIQRDASLDVHYGLIDQGFAFLLAGGLSTIGVICFLIDFALIFSRRLQLQPNISEERTDENR